MLEHLLGDPAVPTAEQPFSIALSPIARQEVEGDPDFPLIFKINIFNVESMMGRRFRVQPGTIAKLNGIFPGVVIDELSGSGNGFCRFGIDSRRSGHGIGSVIMHIQLHFSSSVSF